MCDGVENTVNPQSAHNPLPGMKLPNQPLNELILSALSRQVSNQEPRSLMAVLLWEQVCLVARQVRRSNPRAFLQHVTFISI